MRTTIVPAYWSVYSTQATCVAETAMSPLAPVVVRGYVSVTAPVARSTRPRNYLVPVPVPVE
ncbi:hypothetical protein [Streptomyces sp. bgisy060]|uniref:hypothetical protein n=1 Tax=Streptomyces sp. bgisy060 TaxID=3413775 RepID=UPI003EBED388